MTNKALDKLIYLKKSNKDKIDICEKYLHYKNLLAGKINPTDECLFFNLTNLFFKKIQNGKTITLENINKKMYTNICQIKLTTETPLKFVNWLFSSK